MLEETDPEFNGKSQLEIMTSSIREWKVVAEAAGVVVICKRRVWCKMRRRPSMKLENQLHIRTICVRDIGKGDQGRGTREVSRKPKWNASYTRESRVKVTKLRRAWTR